MSMHPTRGAALIVTLLLAACVASPPRPVPPPPPQDAAPQIDPASRATPVFPGYDAIYGLGGRIILVATVSNTGAVVDVWVERSSGHRELDQSALAAARHWRFIPGERGGRRVGGVVRAPINFDPLPGGEIPHNRLWPDAYAHPHYAADTATIAYPSVEAAYDQVPADAHHSLVDAHSIEQLLVHDAHHQLVQWWIFTDLGTSNAMAVRMTFAGSADDPEVKVASLCTHPSVCAARNAELLKGPIYARSP